MGKGGLMYEALNVSTASAGHQSVGKTWVDMRLAWRGKCWFFTQMREATNPPWWWGLLAVHWIHETHALCNHMHI